MTFEQLLARSAAKEDVGEEDVQNFLTSSNERERAIAQEEVAKTAIRRALATAAGLAHEQHYADPQTLAAIDALAAMTDIDEPYVETLKQRGLQAARGDRFDEAMSLLQSAANRAVVSSNRREARARRVMHYAYDPEIEGAIETLALRFKPPAGRASVNPPLRVTILCSAVQDEDAPSLVTCKAALLLRSAGFDVEVVATETVVSAGSRMCRQLEDEGIPFYPVQGQTYEEKVRWVLSHFAERPANALVSTVQVHDTLGKLIGCIGAAPVQAYLCLTIEPLVGKYDLIVQGVSSKQEIETRWAGRSRYFGTFFPSAKEVDAAEPLSRGLLGVPADGVLLATFGRLTKCDKPVYLAATGQILQREPKAWLLLAGPDDFGALPHIETYYREQGVLDRVRYLGRRQEDGPRLLKTVDVYCDPYPWPGGQSLLDAMYAGLPIVAMRATRDPDLDPTGCGPTSAMAETMLDGVSELAPAGDIDAYVRIALGYINDLGLRARSGRKAREKVMLVCNGESLFQAVAREITSLVLNEAMSR